MLCNIIELPTLEAQFQSCLDHLKQRFDTVREDRVSLTMLDHLVVEYQGAKRSLKGLAKISVTDSHTLTIAPFDAQILGQVSKVISDHIKIAPSPHGKSLMLHLPPMTQERRKEMSELVKNHAEEQRKVMRTLRQKSLDSMKKLKKELHASEDDEKYTIKNIDELTKKYNKQIDDLTDKKVQALLK